MKSCMEPKYLPRRQTAVPGFYSGTFTPLQKQKVHAFQEEAEKDVSPGSKPSAHDDLAVIEKAYWKAVARPTVYGADNEGCLFDKSFKVRN